MPTAFGRKLKTRNFAIQGFSPSNRHVFQYQEVIPFLSKANVWQFLNFPGGDEAITHILLNALQQTL
jgi:hypothetical protein